MHTTFVKYFIKKKIKIIKQCFFFNINFVSKTKFSILNFIILIDCLKFIDCLKLHYKRILLSFNLFFLIRQKKSEEITGFHHPKDQLPKKQNPHEFYISVKNNCIIQFFFYFFIISLSSKLCFVFHRH